MMGIEKFHLRNHISQDNSMEIFKPYIEKVVVDVEKLPENMRFTLIFTRR